jgi:hypothetical protein
VQAPGSSSFVYRKTELVAGPGGTQTAAVTFNSGESVKGRRPLLQRLRSGRLVNV